MSNEYSSVLVQAGHDTLVSYSGPYPVLLAATRSAFLSPTRSVLILILLSTSRFCSIRSKATPSFRRDLEVRISSSFAVIKRISTVLWL